MCNPPGSYVVGPSNEAEGKNFGHYSSFSRCFVSRPHCTFLSLGQKKNHSNTISSASCVTIVRLVFVIHHDFTVNYLVGMSAISIWGVIELGIGIIAGSMATLRPLLRHITRLSNGSSNSDSKPQDQATPYRPAPYLAKVAKTNNPAYCVEDNEEEEEGSSEGGGQKHTLKEMLAMTRVSSRSEC